MQAKIASRCLVWADCEALERRHNLGRGTLVVLDSMPESGTPNYKERRAMLESLVATDAVFSGGTSRPVPCRAVVLTPKIRADSHADALAFYQRLRAANRARGCDFFEGVVMKRTDSAYSLQLRSAPEECRGGASTDSLREHMRLRLPHDQPEAHGQDEGGFPRGAEGVEAVSAGSIRRPGGGLSQAATQAPAG